MRFRQILVAGLVIGTGAAGYFYSGLSPGTNKPGSAVQPNQPPETRHRKSSSNTTKSTKSTERTAPASGSNDESANQSYSSRRASVFRVYDGDSLKVRFLESGEIGEVRIKGIDCPETSEKVDKCGRGGIVDLTCEQQIPLGIRAKSYAKTLLEDEVVTLESYNNFDRGDYGRILAYVRTDDGEDYGLKTVRKGYCNDSGRRYEHPRDERYERFRRPLQQ